MKHVTLLSFTCMVSFAFGQTNYTVDARETTWNPKNLTIDVGDSITWINNNQGTHNVDGTQQTFQYNPEPFGFLPFGTNWTYGHRFNTPGTYSFRCDMYPSTMTGTIIVNEQAQITENKTEDFFISPNPATNSITIKTDWTYFKVAVYDMLGERVLNKTMNNEIILDISVLQSGMYYVKISSDKDEYQQRLMKN